MYNMFKIQKKYIHFSSLLLVGWLVCISAVVICVVFLVEAVATSGWCVCPTPSPPVSTASGVLSSISTSRVLESVR